MSFIYFRLRRDRRRPCQPSNITHSRIDSLKRRKSTSQIRRNYAAAEYKRHCSIWYIHGIRGSVCGFQPLASVVPPSSGIYSAPPLPTALIAHCIAKVTYLIIPVGSPHWTSHVQAPVKPDYESSIRPVIHHLTNFIRESDDRLGLQLYQQLQGVLADIDDKYARKTDVETLEDQIDDVLTQLDETGLCRCHQYKD